MEQHAQVRGPLTGERGLSQVRGTLCSEGTACRLQAVWSTLQKIFNVKQDMIDDKKRQFGVRVLLLVLTISLHTAAGLAQTVSTVAPSVDEAVATLKQLLQESRDRLRAYEWTETTVVRQKGNEKARRLSRCHYRIDGKIEREVMSLAKPEKKKEDVSDYIERAITLVRYYVPP